MSSPIHCGASGFSRRRRAFRPKANAADGVARVSGRKFPIPVGLTGPAIRTIGIVSAKAKIGLSNIANNMHRLVRVRGACVGRRDNGGGTAGPEMYADRVTRPLPLRRLYAKTSPEQR